MGRAGTPQELLQTANVASGMRIAILQSRFNEAITNSLRDGALRALQSMGLASEKIDCLNVPGALELPLLAKLLAHKYDGIICVGAVIKGESAHFDYVCMGVTQGLMQVMLATNLPLANAVLTVYDEAQAQARSGADEHNKGYEAAQVVVEMILHKRSL